MVELFESGRGAVISGCARYRYLLTREVGGRGAGRVLFVMLNPSTADGDVDDATVRGCVARARAWGYGELWVVNLFGLRSTDPRALLLAADAVGPENDVWIERAARGSACVIAAWGVLGWIQGRDRLVLGMLEGIVGRDRIECLGLTKGGAPRHPLYVPRTCGRDRFEWVG